MLCIGGVLLPAGSPAWVSEHSARCSVSKMFRKANIHLSHFTSMEIRNEERLQYFPGTEIAWTANPNRKRMQKISMSTLTVSYHDPSIDPIVFLHVDKIVRDIDLVWLEFRPLPGWPSGAGTILASAAIKAMKIEEE
jgi:hypothetical protein